MCLADLVIYEVMSEKTAQRLWLKLETPYMSKNVTNKLGLGNQLKLIGKTDRPTDFG
ncbi:hypothetical protein LINPERHAP1_LOCUS30582 [Linum perenne]